MVRTRAARKQSSAAKNPQAFIKQISQQTLTSAVSALFKDASAFEKKRREKMLLKEDEEGDTVLDNDSGDFHLVITFKIAPLKEKLRPVAIRLKHSLWKEGEHEVCLFVKDPQRKVKDYLAEHGSGGVSRVLGVDKLRKRYGTHEGRRELCTMFDVFLVDQRVAPMMPNLLGKSFIEAKMVPLAVNMRKNVVEAIRKTLASTPFAPRQGTCTSVKIGRLGFTEQEIVENCLMAAEGVAERCEGGWKNVQSLGLKTSQSPTIQIYLSLPGEEGGDVDKSEVAEKKKKKRKRDDGDGDSALGENEGDSGDVKGGEKKGGSGDVKGGGKKGGSGDVKGGEKKGGSAAVKDGEKKGGSGDVKDGEKKGGSGDVKSGSDRGAGKKDGTKKDTGKAKETPTKRRRTTRGSVKEESGARTRSATTAQRRGRARNA
ncbi:Ribosomal L1 domain-containing protein 1 [Gracilariopsis chorda]|uniref:Ribosomal L1 domain-containing protein 1 n=1 Tax=Gracilariopsis chorda TaxID=448386 RepID=A0A2V3IUT2_9FLOR|nr:Ribosomal L1 domain-containing protein 1 [Gracilariopsis chorda]|eukprot:PXF45898.1 Ribosomal L1 domain-containing protein 1 [Gracilariopsis chorda]